MSSQLQEFYVPIYNAIPEKWEEGREFLTAQIMRMGNGINARSSGFYLREETPAGKQLFGGSTSGQTDQFRAIFRKIVDFGTLPNAGVKTIAHGITLDANFNLVHLDAGAYDPVAFSALPLPFSSPTLNENIKLQIDATNVIVTTAIDYSAYTKCIVTIEYSKEA